MPIKPTVGRVILFFPSSTFTGAKPSEGEPLPALISRVWSDRLINIGGFDADGKPFNATSVPLIQGDEPEGQLLPAQRAEWMPYQKGQAAKHDAQDKQIVAGIVLPPAEGQTTSTRPPHQQRVIDEKAELDDKLTKLKAFFDTPIFAGLDVNERQRLEDQADYMQSYSDVLTARIAAF